MSSSINTDTVDSKIAVSTTHEAGSLWEKERIVLILCGLIASGKSTFAVQLQHHFPQFVRCNQDDLGSRWDVENLARQSLRKGMSVCIDRANFNPQQRSYWIKIAREYPGTLIWLIVFDTPYETCAARLYERESHPTIKSTEQGLSVLARFASDFQYPHPDEGYQRIIYLRPSDNSGPIYSRSDISKVLQRVWDPASASPIGAHIPWSLSAPYHLVQQDMKREETRFISRGQLNDTRGLTTSTSSPHIRR
ncbi:hypothetical protein AX15_003575 [Amanita polypyramis BW_CC]|nr:hypothetical protein AX15_003575 [Amanita polypyramis BW_CC]